MEKSPTRKGPTTPDRQAARPLVLDCALYERECNRPHARSNAFTSPASPHPHGIVAQARAVCVIVVLYFTAAHLRGAIS